MASTEGRSPAAKGLKISPFAEGRKKSLKGTLHCPPDKSVTHRSVMFAAMAKGKSEVLQPLLGADCLSTVGCFKALGVEVTFEDHRLLVSSPGWDGWQSPFTPLDYGNSGTTARLLTGLIAATPGLFVTAFGDGSLSRRPMGRVVEPLLRVGAKIVGRDGGRFLPYAVSGQELKPGDHQVDKPTAQVKSALILAGLNARGTTTVTLPKGSRDHSERMLQALGADLAIKQDNRREEISVRGPFRPNPRTYLVPGDPSSAAFFLVLGALASGTLTVTEVLENPTRTGFLTVLRRMGADIRPTPSAPKAGRLEPVVDLTILGGQELKAVDVEPELAPTLIDEVPILAVAAMFAEGTTRLRGLEELRVKESDRLAKTIELISAAGGKAWAEGDDLLIAGGCKKAAAFSFDPAEDHRLAMTAAIVAKFSEGPCQVQDPECVAVSFPGFFDVLAHFG